MLRIPLAAVFLYFSTLTAFSQTRSDSAYQDRRLTIEEVNFVSGYYRQDGNNSAVTGGIGSEKLSDFATTIDVRLSRYDYLHRKHTLTAEVGVDVYTSASSDMIDPLTISSASSQDVRVYPSLKYAITNEDKGSTLSGTASVSTEYDYFSAGLGAGWSKLSKNRNRELSLSGQVFLDTWNVILPVELRSSTDIRGSEPRNSYSLSITLSQVLSRRLQLMFVMDLAFQEGQLATLYHRTYFEDMSHKVEKLPDTRFKVPIGMRLNYFLADRYILRTYYRYYQDSWGMSAHTAELEVAIKVTPFLSISPFYRNHRQVAAKFFKPFAQHQTSEEFYTSDFDLSTQNTNFFGVGLRYAPPGGIAGLSRLNTLELRFGRYERSTGLSANIVTLSAKLK